MTTIATNAAPRRPALWGTGSRPWVLALLALAVLGFWKPYFSRLAAADAATHLHAALMLAWFGLVIVQPLLIGTRRFALHRTLGRTSYALVPLIVVSAVWLAHTRVGQAPPERFGFQAHVLFLGLFGCTMFVFAWAMAMLNRREAPLHARYMIGTVLVLIDPALTRVMIFWLPPLPFADYQWIVYGLLYAMLLILIFLERDQPRGRSAFPVLLGMFLVSHVLTQTVTPTAAWHDFARWFAALPLPM